MLRIMLFRRGELVLISASASLWLLFDGNVCVEDGTISPVAVTCSVDRLLTLVLLICISEYGQRDSEARFRCSRMSSEALSTISSWPILFSGGMAEHVVGATEPP